MAGAMNRGLLTTRVWSMLQDGPMTSEELYHKYVAAYGTGKAVDRPSTFVQIVMRCGLMKKVGETKVVTKYLTGGATRRTVSVWEAKTLPELVKPYLKDGHPLRKLSRMPKFVRDAVKDARGECNES
tara:strand:- start:20596 stop:20976 length:381 start_codon:yes stop_codon:yes gene_type:complete